jgi:hypothetical protein
MADHRSGASANFAEHEATYRSFLLLLKVSFAATAVTLGLLYYFLAR